MSAEEQLSGEEFSEQQQEVLASIRMSRIVLPVLIGVVAVFYLLWRQFDPKEFASIDWTRHTYFWIGIAMVFVVSKHLSYAARLHVLSEGAFSWRKCIELIFIWEFSSAVSPTAVGGSAVAFFVLAQEKLPTARTATIVLYTVVLDGLFFILSLPVLYLYFGSNMIRPEVHELSDIGGWGYYFLFAYGLMAVYSGLFYYGIFINPGQIQRILSWITGFGLLKRFHEKALHLGADMVLASADMKNQSRLFHLKAFLATAMAWSSRFIILNCLIIGFITALPTDFFTQFELFARLEAMFVIIAFSPTPGGAGFVEILFGGFLTDYVDNPTYATVISTIWRLIAYYSYLFAGVVIIPNWIRKVVNERRQRRIASGDQAPSS